MGYRSQGPRFAYDWLTPLFCVLEGEDEGPLPQPDEL